MCAGRADYHGGRTGFEIGNLYPLGHSYSQVLSGLVNDVGAGVHRGKCEGTAGLGGGGRCESID